MGNRKTIGEGEGGFKTWGNWKGEGIKGKKGN